MMLKLENLVVHIKTDLGIVRAVDGVDLEVSRGERFVLIGESGSGKSVLAQAILRLLPKNAEIRGRIVFDGMDILKLSEEEMRKIRGRRIAWIPQSQSSLNPVLTVGFQCAEPVIEHLKLDRRSALGRILRVFEFLGIGRNRVGDYPHQFSGGMRQRVLVAMGTAADPDLLIADEPTKGLDAGKREQVVDVFKKVDKTMLIITHDLRFAERIADRIAVMYCGKIVEVSSAKDFFKEPLHPYSMGLLESLPPKLKPIRGFQPSMINPPEGCRFRERCDFAKDVCSREPPVVNVNGRIVRCWLYDRGEGYK